MDMERVDNTASCAQPPVPRGTRNQDPGGYIANCTSGTVNDDPVGIFLILEFVVYAQMRACMPDCLPEVINVILVKRGLCHF